MTNTQKSTLKFILFTVLVFVACFMLFVAISTIKIATILIIPALLLVLLGTISDIKQYKKGVYDISGFMSAIICCSFLFWPSIIISLFTNIFTIIIYVIIFLFIIKLYTIFTSDENLF